MDILIHSMPLWVELISTAFCTGILVFFLFILSDAENADPRLQNRLWLLFFVSVAAAPCVVAPWPVATETSPRRLPPVHNTAASTPSATLASMVRVMLVSRPDLDLTAVVDAMFFLPSRGDLAVSVGHRF